MLKELVETGKLYGIIRIITVVERELLLLIMKKKLKKKLLKRT